MKSSLNHIYRSIWSEALNTWVAVSEITSAKGKPTGSSREVAVAAGKSGHKSNRKPRFKPIESFLKSLALAVACCYALNSQANPFGAQVVNGAAAINQIGNTLTVTNSPNAILNWQGFSINKGETTNFIQQSAASSVLNRVVGPDPSQLLGALTSNGKVFLINPAGIMVGQGARVDVAGFVASTLNLSNADFLAGKLNFTNPSPLGGGAGEGVVNQGSITTPEGGMVYLVAPQVENHGIINTPQGETILAAGNTVQLMDTGTPGVTVQVTGADNSATNLGQILADSGRIGMVGAVVKNSGTVNANSLVSEGGRVFLRASQSVDASGTISAQGTSGGNIDLRGDTAVAVGGTVSADGTQQGGEVTIGGGGVSLAGRISATGGAGQGGSISIQSQTTNLNNVHTTLDVSGASGGSIRETAGHQITSSATYLATGTAGNGGYIGLSAPATKLLSAQIDVSGTTGGGQIRVGGEFQGGKSTTTSASVPSPSGGGLGWGNAPLPNAETLAISAGSNIKADATQQGNGGTVILWSDLTSALYADVSAQGKNGTGGFIELSSAEKLLWGGSANAGIGGQVLMDPKNIVIQDATAGSVQYNLTLGYNYLDLPRMKGNDLEANDYFGYSVSLSGTQLAVGAPFDDGFGNTTADSGAVYLFSNPYSTPTLSGIIGKGYSGTGNYNLSTLETSDWFGISVSLSGAQLVAGAQFDDGFGNVATNSGAVYLFNTPYISPTLSGTIGKSYTGVGSYDLVALEANDGFGSSISLSDTQLAVGAYCDSGLGNTTFNAGAVYLFNSPYTAPTLSGVIGKGYTGGGNYDLIALEVGDLLGTSVSLSGTQLAAGAYADDGSGNVSADSGAMYLFSNPYTTPTLSGIIGKGYTGAGNYDLTTLEVNDRLGNAVSLSGTMLAVGAYTDDGFGNVAADSGAVYLFSNPYTTPSLSGIVGKGYTGAGNYDLTALEAGDNLGVSVSLSGTQLAVGAFSDAGSGNVAAGSGAVYLFNNPFTALALSGIIGKGYTGAGSYDLTALEAGDLFGSSISLPGTQLAVGTRGDGGSDNATPGSGAVYLFRNPYTTPTLSGIIGRGYTGAGNYDMATLEAADLFGSSVSLSGTQLAVGAMSDDGSGNAALNSGAIYLFNNPFTAPALSGTIGKGYTGAGNYDMAALEGGDFFGSSVSLSGTQLAVGASYDSGFGNVAARSGAVYLFNNPFTALALSGVIGKGYTGAGNYNLTALEAYDYFGSSISLSGTQLAVGAMYDGGSGNVAVGSGAVYLFNDPFTTPALSGTIGKGYTGAGSYNVTMLEVGDKFGSSVSFSGTQLAVGAMNDGGSGNVALNSGAVYLFNTPFSAPTLSGIIGKGYSGAGNYDLASLEVSDWFGSSVSLSGTQLAVGGMYDGGSGNAAVQSGAVYLFNDPFTSPALSGVIGKGYGAGSYDVAVLPEASDQFGSSVSLSGTLLAVGIMGDAGSGNVALNSGAVYLFNNPFTAPALSGIIGKGYAGAGNYDVATLETGDWFGSAVSLSGTQLVVGALGDSGFDNATLGSGAVYLFNSPYATPTLSGIIGKGYTGAGNFDVAALEMSDNFGSSVSFSGTQLVVGASKDGGFGNTALSSGAAYLFSNPFTAPTLSGIIGKGYTGAGNYDLAALEMGDSFGSAVSLSGTQLAVGASGDSGSGNAALGSGVVYLFNNSFTAPALSGAIGKGYTGAGNYDLTALEMGDSFGSSVSLSATQLAVGALGDGGFGNTALSSGATYLFSNPFTAPRLSGIIGKGYTGAGNYDLAALEMGDNFGSSVSLSGAQLAVGAPWDGGLGNAALGSGAVYLFTLTLGLGNDPASGQTFGANAGSDSSITPDSITAILDTGSALTLQANNDITVMNAIIANNLSGNGGDLTLQAGRSTLINADIDTDNGALTLIANDPGANPVYRDTGAAVLDTSLATLTAGSVSLTNSGGDILVGTINAGAGAFTASGNLNVNGAVSAGAVTVNANTFTLSGGTWDQVAATLPGFTVNDFSITGGTFIRALGGDGSVGTPYQLADIYGVQGMGSSGMLGNSYVLANNIDASGTVNWNAGEGFAPTGDATTPFTGAFDGQNFTISNLSINRVADYQGLFGYVGAGGSISNLGLLNATVTGGWYVGALAGYNDGTIGNTHASGGSVSGDWAVGGLVGYNATAGTSGSGTTASLWGGRISNSYVSGGTVSGGATSASSISRIGGLVGENRGAISSSYVDSGSVTAYGWNANQIGGLAGSNSGAISDSHVAGVAVSASGGGNSIGGLAGYNNGSISNSFVSGGTVSGSNNVGGLVGYNYGSISGSHVDTGIMVNGWSNVGGLVGHNATAGSSGSGTTANLWGGRISNSYVSGGTVSGNNNVGGLVGYNATAGSSGSGTTVNLWGGRISNSYVSGGTVNGGTSGASSISRIGGLVGGNAGAISSSYVDGGSVTAYGSSVYEIGGLAGHNSGTISDSHVANVTLGATGNGNSVGGLVGNNYGSISNSYVSGGSVSGDWVVGGLVGSNATAGSSGSGTTVNLWGGRISNSYVSGGTVNGGTSSASQIGGLVGVNRGMISSSYVDIGTVSGRTTIGGLVGSNRGSISNSHVSGVDVSGSSNSVGGLAGNNYTNISNSYVSGGSVTGSSYVGGLVGFNSGSTMESCYSGCIGNSYVSGGTVAGSSYVGGLAGRSGNELAISNSHYDVDAVTINGVNAPTFGGLYSTQYTDWFNGGALTPLDILNYGSTLGWNATSGSYEINSVQGMKDMLGFADNPVYTFSLSANIDLTATPGYNVHHLAGDFDGAGFTISNLSVSLPNSNVGLFGHVAASSTVSNLGLLNANVTGWSAGALAGWNEGNIGGSRVENSTVIATAPYSAYAGGLAGNNVGSISNSYVNGGTVSGLSNVGGLAGYSSGTISGSHVIGGSVGGSWTIGGLVGYNYGTISNSYVSGGSVSGSSRVGGLVGRNDFGSVDNSYVSGSTVIGNNTWTGSVGGLVGYNSGSISNTYVSGGSVASAASDSGWVGGLVGNNLGTIATSYASTGVIGGAYGFAGLVGGNNGGGSVTDSFWDIDTSGQATGIGSGATAGAIGIYTADAFTQTTYGGFDFTSGAPIWWISDTNTRPFLRSEWSNTITNAHQLQLMAMNTGAIYTLANNIDLAPALAAGGMWDAAKGFAPVGDGTINFTGAFDGLGHTVTGLTINRGLTDSIGLFGWTNGATISNVGLVGGSVSGNNQVGGLVGRNEYGTISNSYSTGSVGGSGYVGGLVGVAHYGSVSNAYSTGSVSGSDAVGGLMGHNNYGTVSNAYATGSVNGVSSVGGLLGNNYGTVSNVYATGSVSGTTDVGGLAGYNNNYGHISNAYATGSVSGSSNVGGLVGYTYAGGTVSNSYWNTQTTGQTLAVGLDNGATTATTGLTTAQMKDSANFTGWDFATVWNIDAGSSYPYLRTNEQIPHPTLMFSAISWDGGAGDWLWASPLNWSNDMLPGFASNVTLGAAGTVYLTSGNYTVNSLVCTAGSSLDVSGGSLTVSDTTTLDGGLTVSGGSAALNGALNGAASGQVSISAGSLSLAVAASVSSLSMTGGTLGGTGNVTVNTGGSFTWTNGVIAGSGALITQTGVATTLAPGFAQMVALRGSRVWDNFGTVTFTPNAGTLSFFQIDDTTGDGTATFNNNSGAIFNINASFNDTHTIGVGTFNNAGELRKSLNTTAATSGFLPAFNNQSGGVVNVNSGVLRFDMGGTDAGNYALANGATLQFNGGPRSISGNIGGTGNVTFSKPLTATAVYTLTGDYNVSGITTAALDSLGTGTLAFNGTITNLGTSYIQFGGVTNVSFAGMASGAATGFQNLTSIAVNDGSVAFANGTNFSGLTSLTQGGSGTLDLGNNTISVSALNLTGGALTGSGNITVTTGGSFNWGGSLNAMIAGSGTLTTQSGVTTNITPGFARTASLRGSRVWDNYGAVTFTPNAGTLSYFEVDDTTGDGAAVFNNKVGGLFNINASVNDTHTIGAGAFSNEGEFRKSFNTSVATSGFAPAFNNQATGVVNVNSGTLNVAGALTQSGTFNIATGATFSKAAGFTNTGTLSGTGTIAVGTGAAGLINQGNINPGGTGVAGTLAVTGDVQLSTGSNLNVELGGTGAGQSDVLTVTGSITTAGALNASLLAGYTPVNADAIPFMTMGGTASGTFSTTSLPASFIAGYNLAAGEAARLIYASGPGTFTFTNAAGGLDWAAPGNWSSGILPGSLDTALLSSGFAVTHATGTDTIAALTINSGNALDVSGGSLTVSGITTLDGGLTVSGTGSAALNGALNGAVSGQVNVSGGSLNLGGATALAMLNMTGGTLSQVSANLPAFSITDFRLAGGTFIRALGGDGSTGNPFQLDDIYGVQGMGSAGMLGNSYVLANNVDASGTVNWNAGAGFVPVGNLTTQFTGTFDGLGHAVTTLTINRPAQSWVGLFGYTIGATISNVGLVGGSVSGSGTVGGLVGGNSLGTITGSYSTGSVIGTGNAVGGLVGWNGLGTITNSYSTGAVSGGGTYVGGLVGSSNGVITNSYSTGNVAGTNYVGGLVGWNDTNTISNSYSTGTVGGTNYVGGLVGYNRYDGTITNTYSTGAISGSVNVGGLVGFNDSGIITSSYWDNQTSGQIMSSGGVGLDTAHMMTMSSFAGWNIADTGGAGATWRIYEGSTAPLLASFLKPLTITADPVSKTYDGLAHSGGLANPVYSPVIPDMTHVQGGTSAYGANAINAGTYAPALYSDQQGYDISYVGGMLTVNPYVVSMTGARTYDGTANVDAGIFTLGALASGETLVLSGVGTLAGKNVVTNGAVTLGTLTLGNGTGLASNYTFAGGTQTATVTQLALTGTAIAGVNATYGTPAAAGAVTFGNVIAGDAVSSAASIDSPAYSSSGNLNAGGYTQTASTLSGTDAGNYSFAGFTSAANYIITPLALTGSITVGSSVYGSTLVQGTSSFSNVVGADVVIPGAVAINITGNTSSSGNLNAGSYAGIQSVSALSGADAGNYTFAGIVGGYTVNPLPLVGSITAGSSAYGSTLVQGTASFSNVVGADVVIPGAVAINTTGNTSSSGNLNAGSYTGIQSVNALSGTDAGNYTFTGIVGDYTVNPLALTGAAIAGVTTAYGTPAATGAVTFGNVIAGDVVNSTASINSPIYSSSGNLNAGGYTQTASTLSGADAGNYSFAGFTSAANYTITPLALTGATIAGVNTTYGTPAATGVVTFGNVISGDAVNSTASINSPIYSSSGNLNAGSYTQTASTLSGADAGNYTFAGFTTVGANYTVGQLALAGSITAGTSVYGSMLAPGTASFTNAIAGDALGAATVAVNTAGNTSTSGNLRVGSYTGIQSVSALSGAGAGNYTFAGIVGDYAVNPLVLTGTAIAGVTTTYGTPASTGAVTFGNAISGDAVSSMVSINSPTYSGSGNLIAGSYTQTASALSGADAGNYSFGGFTTAGANYIVNPALLSIIANADSKIYDGLAYSGGNGVVYSGLVNGETSSVLGGALFYSGTSQGATEVGSYSITPGGLTSGNYSISYVDGTLTVNPPITTEVMQTLDMLTTTNTLIPATTSDVATSDEPSTAPVDIDANALLGAAAAGAAGGNATATDTTAGWTIGGTADTFGGADLVAPAPEPAPSVDAPAGTDKGGEIIGGNGSGKNGEADKQEDSSKDADENIAKKGKDKGKDKDEDNKDNKEGKPSEKPEKC